MPQIFIKSSIALEDRSGAIRTFGLPIDTPFHNEADGTELTFRKGETHGTLEINNSFTYEVGSKCIGAFEESLKRDEGTCINIAQPKDGKIENFLQQNSRDWLVGNKYIRTMRWLGNMYVKTAIPNVTWSLDNEVWHKFCLLNFVLGDGSCDYKIEPDLLINLVNEEMTEPLPFNLLREAEKLQSSSPKSSLILLSAALEVGAKQFINFKDSNFEWIFDNMQSPPIDKLIIQYIPLLEPSLSFNNDTQDEIRSLISGRNNLVHTGSLKKGEPEIAEPANFVSQELELVMKRFSLVRDILYLFARYSGHGWVTDCVHILKKRLN
ncbi:MAG TPA: hypothetical protein VGN64_25175 [Dyadobacter sp.]|jgi:hypothetical protein|nr:hypothetical protein [Dyadobacter sp.]